MDREKMKIRGSRAVVTGAASGIGAATSRELGRCKVDLFLTSHPTEQEALDSLASEIRAESGVEVVTHTADLLDESCAHDIVAAAGEGRPVDILVNNAGLLSYGSFHEIDIDAQLRMVRVNIDALVRVTHAFSREMIDRRSGRILNISSVSAFQPTAYHAVYAATKSFVQSFSEAIRMELAPHGVVVSTLNPPYTRTPLIDSVPDVAWTKFVPTMTAEDVAIAAVEAIERGRLYHIPGLRSRLAHTLGPRLLPRSVVAWVGAKMAESH